MRAKLIVLLAGLVLAPFAGAQKKGGVFIYAYDSDAEDRKGMELLQSEVFMDPLVRHYGAQLHPTMLDAKVHGETLAALGDIGGAASELRRILEQQTDWPPAANNLAWILSASPDPELRDGKKAVHLATVAQEVVLRLPAGESRPRR